MKRKALKFSQQQEDMVLLFSQKLYHLAEDMAWRCQEAELREKDFHIIMAMGCMWGAARALAASTKATGDKEFAQIFRLMLKEKRKGD